MFVYYMYIHIFRVSCEKDVDDASAALDEPRFAVFNGDAFFSLGTEGSGAAAPEAWSTRDFMSAMHDAERQAEKR